ERRRDVDAVGRIQPEKLLPQLARVQRLEIAREQTGCGLEECIPVAVPESAERVGGVQEEPDPAGLPDHRHEDGRELQRGEARTGSSPTLGASVRAGCYSGAFWLAGRSATSMIERPNGRRTMRMTPRSARLTRWSRRVTPGLTKLASSAEPRMRRASGVVPTRNASGTSQEIGRAHV